MLRRCGNAARRECLLRRNTLRKSPARPPLFNSLLESLEPRCLLSVADPFTPAPKPNVLVVNTLADPQTWDPSDKVLSLREALALASATPEPDLVRFAPCLFAVGPATLVLEGPAFTLAGPITLQGPGQSLLTLDGNASHGRIGRILTVTPDAVACVSGLTFTGGNVLVTGGESNGGAILNTGALTLADSALTHNQAALGGAICSANFASDDHPVSLVILRSTLTANTAANDGGALFTLRSTLNLASTLLAGNSATQGGALSLWRYIPVQVSGSTFVANTATSGGAIYSCGPLAVSASLFQANTAVTGGAITVDNAPLTLADSLLADNAATTGGAVASLWSGTGAIAIDRSAFLRNAATTGGALSLAGGTLYLRHSTLADNSADSGGALAVLTQWSSHVDLFADAATFSRNTARLGGALFADAAAGAMTLNVTASTFSANRASKDGGGVYVARTPQNGVVLNLAGTTLARNAASGDGGALYLASIHVDGLWTDTSITDNTAAGYGGGIYSQVICRARITWTGGSLQSNSAYDGGGLYFSLWSPLWDHGPSQWTFTGVAVVGNSARHDGGGVYAWAYNFDSPYLTPMNFTFNNCLFLGNSAGHNGGALYVFSSKYSYSLVQIADTLILANSAGDQGGALYLDSEMTSPPNTLTLVLTRTTLAFNTAGTYGGGLSYDPPATQLLLDPATVITANFAPLGGSNIYVRS